MVLKRVSITRTEGVKFVHKRYSLFVYVCIGVCVSLRLRDRKRAPVAFTQSNADALIRRRLRLRNAADGDINDDDDDVEPPTVDGLADAETKSEKTSRRRVEFNKTVKSCFSM